MQLFLVNNDPLDTLLVSQDGEPLYSIHSYVDTHPNHSVAFQRPHSFSQSSSSSTFSSTNSQPSSTFSDSHSSASSVAPAPGDQSYHSPPSLHLGYRQAPADLHPAIPITRTHSNPHPDAHRHWQDPSSPHPSPVLPPSSPSSPFSTATGAPRLVTNIKRLDRHNSSSGNVETEVGRVEYSGDDVGTRVQLCHLGMELCTPAIPRQRKRSHMSSFTAPSTSGSAPEAPRTVSTVAVRANDAGTALDAFRDFCLEKQKTKESSKGSSSQTDDPGFYDDQECIPDPTWSFKGPDSQPYKWISLASNPVLINDTQPPTPLACYRPAKLGIVSRSRRGFLEILPTGISKEDWIVATFAGYFRMKLGDRPPLRRAQITDHPTTTEKETAGLPMGMGNIGLHAVGPGAACARGGGIGARKSLSAPTTPLTRSWGSLSSNKKHPGSSSASALASLEALRRKNKDYGYGSAKRTW